jgi:hypothetical protein
MSNVEVSLGIADLSGQGDSEGEVWPFLTVPVFLNSKGPFSFGLEIPRGMSMVSEHVVRSLGIEPLALSELSLVGDAKFPMLRLDSFSIGSAALRNFSVMVWPGFGGSLSRDATQNVQRDTTSKPENNSGLASQDWNGVVGFDFLRHFRVTLDFSAKKLSLMSPQ